MLFVAYLAYMLTWVDCVVEFCWLLGYVYSCLVWLLWVFLDVGCYFVLRGLCCYGDFVVGGLLAVALVSLTLAS